MNNFISGQRLKVGDLEVKHSHRQYAILTVKTFVTSLLRLLISSFFFSNNCLRPHCYECPYAQMGRAADFTIADFWGISIFHPQYFDKDGVSLVLINSNNALNIFNNLQNIDSLRLRLRLPILSKRIKGVLHRRIQHMNNFGKIIIKRN